MRRHRRTFQHFRVFFTPNSLNPFRYPYPLSEWNRSWISRWTGTITFKNPNPLRVPLSTEGFHLCRFTLTCKRNADISRYVKVGSSYSPRPTPESLLSIPPSLCLCFSLYVSVSLPLSLFLLLCLCLYSDSLELRHYFSDSTYSHSPTQKCLLWCQ